MKKRGILAVLLVLALCFVTVLTVFAVESHSSIDWDDVFFDTMPQMESRTAETTRVVDHSDLLHDRGGVQVTQFTQIYSLSYFTFEPENIEAFAHAVRSGQRVLDMFEASGDYIARNGSDTVVMRRNGDSFYVAQVWADNAGALVFIDDSIRTGLNARRMTPAFDMAVRFVAVPGVGMGMLFSNEDTELITFTSSRFDTLLPNNTVYTIEQLVSFMEQNIDIITTAGAIPVDFSDYQ